MSNNDLTFLCATDDRNLPFALPFMYFANKFNPCSCFDIYVFKSSRQDYTKLNEGIAFLKSDCNASSINISYVTNSNHKPQHYRFIIDPTLKTEYTYIGDIDIMICENIKQFHLEKMSSTYVYDNELRGYSDPTRLSGLHFASVRWFEKTSAYRLKLLKEKTTGLNDEKMLADIAMKSNVKLRPALATQEQFNDARPAHGQHISLSRKPFKKDSVMHVVLDQRFKEQFIATLNEVKFKALLREFCQKETTDIFKTYASYVGIANAFDVV